MSPKKKSATVLKCLKGVASKQERGQFFFFFFSGRLQQQLSRNSKPPDGGSGCLEREAYEIARMATLTMQRQQMLVHARLTICLSSLFLCFFVSFFFFLCVCVLVCYKLN